MIHHSNPCPLPSRTTNLSSCLNSLTYANSSSSLYQFSALPCCLPDTTLSLPSNTELCPVTPLPLLLTTLPISFFLTNPPLPQVNSALSSVLPPKRLIPFPCSSSPNRPPHTGFLMVPLPVDYSAHSFLIDTLRIHWHLSLLAPLFPTLSSLVSCPFTPLVITPLLIAHTLLLVTHTFSSMVIPHTLLCITPTFSH